MINMKIDENVMANIIKIIENGEDDKAYVTYNFSGACAYVSTTRNSNVLSLRKNSNNYSITSIELKNQRKGTFTKILKELYKVASNEGKQLLIQNVVTEPMMEFCNKNKFKMQSDGMSDFCIDGFGGSYIVEF